ncbi:MAG: hypothetical protein AAGE80_06225 [Pseudomonadota bacterium]
MRITAFVTAAALALAQSLPAYAQEPVPAAKIQSTQTVEEGGLAQGPLDDFGEVEAAVALAVLALLGVGLALALGGGGGDSTSTPTTN